MIKLINFIKNDLGALDRVLVTLLLVMVAIAALVGMEQWASQQKDNLQQDSVNKINSVLEEK